MAQRRVLIVHQTPLFREVMEQLLSKHEGISVVAATTDRAAGLRLASEEAVDTLILEAGDEGEEHTLAFVSEATRDCQELRTIALNLSNTGYAVYSAKSLHNIEPQELVSLLLEDAAEGTT
jgi:DNA-binding NarL/FixJ family response regulator